jgi:hypothetical protein
MVHETWRDYGWHQGGCTKCECESFYAKRTFEKDVTNGYHTTPDAKRIYTKNYITKATRCEE